MDKGVWSVIPLVDSVPYKKQFIRILQVYFVCSEQIYILKNSGLILKSIKKKLSVFGLYVYLDQDVLSVDPSISISQVNDLYLLTLARVR